MQSLPPKLTTCRYHTSILGVKECGMNSSFVLSAKADKKFTRVRQLIYRVLRMKTSGSSDTHGGIIGLLLPRMNASVPSTSARGRCSCIHQGKTKHWHLNRLSLTRARGKCEETLNTPRWSTSRCQANYDTLPNDIFQEVCW